MASDNYTPPGSGITFRSTSDGSLQWPVGVTSYATTLSAGANVLQVVTLTSGLPVQPQTGSTWAVSQSGSWAVSVSGTVPISAASLPLPTGAATDATLSSLSGKIVACNTGAVTISAALPAGTNLIGSVGARLQDGSGTALTSALRGSQQALSVQIVDSSGNQIVGATYLSSLPTLTNGQTTPLLTDVNGGLLTNPGALSQAVDSVATYAKATTAGGVTPYHYTLANSTNATTAKAAATQLYQLRIVNKSTTEPVWVHLVDKATTPVPGSETVKGVICAPAAVSSTQPTVVIMTQPLGVAFAAGVSFWASAGNGTDTDATALSAASEAFVDLHLGS